LWSTDIQIFVTKIIQKNVFSETFWGYVVRHYLDSVVDICGSLSFGVGIEIGRHYDDSHYISRVPGSVGR